MKKWLNVLLLIVLVGSITACTKETDTPKPDSTQEKEAVEEDVEEKVTEEKEIVKTQLDETKDYKEGVIDASKLFIKSGVAFWGYNQQLCSAVLDDNHDMYDFISEGTLNGDIYCIAVDGNDMYLSTEKGIVCLPLEESNQEQSQVSVINESELRTSSFQIYDGNIYFTYGGSLYSVPKEGGDKKALEENIEAFQVTVEGVYCLNEKGDLLRVSLDGTERKTLCELDSEGDIFIRNDKAYITTGDDKDYVYVYELEEDVYEKLHFEEDLSPYHPVWVTKECIYYESEHYEIFRYDLETGTESRIEALYDLPDYDEGYLENDVLYYVSSDDLYWMHLNDGESFKVSKGEVLGNNSDSDMVSDMNEPDIPTDYDGYNIAENIGVFNSEGQARLESKYFTLYLPADGDWTYIVHDNTTIGIYYRPAYESGAGGNLVTIKAFDWDDNSYIEFPAYTLAGLSEDKKYIAIFPTDVQYDASQEAGYRRMYEYVRRIDNSEEGAEDNPFYCE